MIKNFFRYPGGKNKLKEQIYYQIIQKINIDNIDKYVEPFLGGGSFAIFLMQKLKENVPFYLNDYDYNLFCLWKAIQFNHKELIDKIYSYKPTVDSYFDFKTILQSDNKDLPYTDIAFKKLALHQISYSGLATKSGSPIGGINQNSNYKIDCRWSPKNLEKSISAINDLFAKRETIITNYSFENILLNNNLTDKTLVYLDPPYFEVGNQLYEVGMTENEHVNLFKILSNTNFNWFLSYDNNDYIKNLYKGFSIKDINVNYTINNSGNNKEILIINNKCQEPLKLIGKITLK